MAMARNAGSDAGQAGQTSRGSGWSAGESAKLGLLMSVAMSADKLVHLGRRRQSVDKAAQQSGSRARLPARRGSRAVRRERATAGGRNLWNDAVGATFPVQIIPERSVCHVRL